MDTTSPYADVVPGPRGQLLATLLQLRTPATVRALARHSGVSPQRALTLVHELDEAGLVTTTRAGSAIMVTLNRDHLAVQPLQELMAIRKRLVEKLKETLSPRPDLAAAWLYGSTARGEGTRESDIDLLLVTETSIDDEGWIDLTDRLRDHVQRWTGNEAHVVEHTRQSFTELVQDNNPLVTELRTDGVPLTDSTPALLRPAA